MTEHSYIVDIRLLGESSIQVNETRVAPSATHLFALMLYLGVERGRSVLRSELAALLFPEEETSTANHNLRQLLYRMRRLGVPLDATSTVVRIREQFVRDDVTEMLSESHLWSIREMPKSLDLLPYYAPPTPPLSQWLERFRERVQPQLAGILGGHVQAARLKADWDAVMALARLCLQADPYHETATLCLAEALARTGSKQRAVQLLRTFELEVGQSASSLALPPRLLSKRITESTAHHPPIPDVPLLGRSDEMSRVTACWSRAREGQFVSLRIVGPESIGKSRLASELASVVRVDGSGAILPTPRVASDRLRPLSLFADACSQLLCMPGAAGCSPHSVPFLSRLTKISTSRAEEFSVEYNLADDRNAVQHALIDLLDSVVSERPLLWIVDNADHLDEGSARLLAALRNELTTKPLFILLCSRDSHSHDVVAMPCLRLGPLAREASTKLAKVLKGPYREHLTDETTARCVSLAAGNPGHLQLLLLHRARPDHDTHVPTDLIAAIDDRVMALSPQALHALQACALFGASCTTDDVGALTGLSGYALLLALQELEHEALITRGDSGLLCNSGLIKDRAEASTASGVKELFHRRSARRLEEREPANSHSQATAWQIAEHWASAGAAETALEWRRRCWLQLVAIGQPISAAEGIRSALQASASPSERAVLLTELASALRSAGEFGELRDVLAQRTQLCDHIGDDTGTRSALGFDVFEADHQHRVDLQPYLTSLKFHVRNHDLDVVRRLRASRMLMVAADHAFDRSVADDAYDDHEAIQPIDARSSILHQHARLIYHAVFGDRCMALKCAGDLEHLAEETEQSWSSVSSLITASLARRIVDPTPHVYARLEQSVERCRHSGMLRLCFVQSVLITGFLLDDGQLEAARAWLRETLLLAERIGDGNFMLEYLQVQIDLALLAGDLLAARALLERRLAVAPPSPGPRLMRESLLYRLRVDAFCGITMDDADFAMLEALHHRAQPFSRHDDHIEVLWVALSQRNEAECASHLLKTYLRDFRREARPCNYLLWLRTASDPVWCDSSVARLVPRVT